MRTKEDVRHSIQELADQLKGFGVEDALALIQQVVLRMIGTSVDQAIKNKFDLLDIRELVTVYEQAKILPIAPPPVVPKAVTPKGKKK